MILEIATCTIMGGLLGYTMLDSHGTTEASKIQRIASSGGLNVKEGKKTHTIQLLRRRRHLWGTEYVYRIPLGLSFDDFQRKKKLFEDGLNHKRGLLDLTIEDLKTLKLRGDIIEQIKKLLTGSKRKEIVMDYDGALKIKVYREPLPELIEFNVETLKRLNSWKVNVGESRECIIDHDFDKIPHMVTAGMTRYGKSVFLKNIITTLIHNQPEAVKFTLIDLKGGLAFNRYARTKQVNTVAKDVDETLEALQTLHAEIKQRQEQFLSKGFEDVRESKMKERHFVIVDEGAELASHGEVNKSIKVKKMECERILSEIARIGGGLGYRLIFATQYPTADTLPRQIKQNCDARLCFRLPTEIASHVVLDESGAESLPLIKGRAIYRTDRKQIVQTPFIDNTFIDKTIRPHITIKARSETNAGASTFKSTTRREYTLIIEEA